MNDDDARPDATPDATPGADEVSEVASRQAPRPRVAVIAPRRAPEQTSDDTDRGWGERVDDAEHDQWLQEQRPPHWE